MRSTQRETVLFPGQKVISTSGEVVTIAFVCHGYVFAYDRNGLPKMITVCTDAWGFEHDQTIGLAT